MLKNKADYIFIYAEDTATGLGKTGATITASIVKDGGASAASTNSVTEISAGTYRLLLTAAEKNADSIAVIPATVTANTKVYPIYIETQNVASLLWDELTASHVTANTVGKVLSDLSGKLPTGYIAEQTTLLQVQSDTQAINAVMPAGQVMAQSDLADIATPTSVANVQTTADNIYNIVDLISSGVIPANANVVSVNGIAIVGSNVPSDVLMINGSDINGGDWEISGKKITLTNVDGTALSISSGSTEPSVLIKTVNANADAVLIANEGVDSGTSVGKAIEIISSCGGSAVNIEANSTNGSRITDNLQPAVKIYSGNNNAYVLDIKSESQRAGANNNFQGGICIKSDILGSPTLWIENSNNGVTAEDIYAPNLTHKVDEIYAVLPEGHKGISSLALTDLVDGEQIGNILKLLLAKANGEWVLDDLDPSVVHYKARDNNTIVTSVKITDTGRLRL